MIDVNAKIQDINCLFLLCVIHEGNSEISKCPKALYLVLKWAWAAAQPEV